MRRKKGFTLLELIIVIIVIGILASIALPRYLRVAEKGRMAEGKSILGALRSAQMRFAAEHGNFSNVGDCSELDAEMTAFKYFQYPAGGSCQSTDPIASVERNSLDAGSFVYSMGIGGDGNMTCTGASCADLGM